MNWKNAGENPFIGWFRMLITEACLSLVGVRFIFQRQFLWFESRRRLVYLFCSPWAISRRFLDDRGELEAQGYGETPLVTLEAVARRLELSTGDRILELGCGTGRNCVWLAANYGCHIDGVEQIPTLVRISQRLLKGSSLTDKVTLSCMDMFELDMSSYRLVYVDCTAMSEACIRQVAMLCAGLPNEARVVTVNASLSELMPERFQLERVFPGLFIWGWSDMRIQRVGMPEDYLDSPQVDSQSDHFNGNCGSFAAADTEAGDSALATGAAQGMNQ
ncbi:class I SAM-dependent methyltransferase [Sansalvadorimonas sp. 2012CJ34-2]|uniref:Class I SAM-dependent methyltransferase n=1 Tax=Parendozoicomonas callyspongiae TaxID=2942213 RepID=A0ABT0PC42_9GAMM|nr:class I SAM-dependent methyltransferase [Sansalvadorimonas sp. 2012CJ34-2]MCL6268952.1 class I SAM-dependent methyltransferase [Sansalvadorimonas sp. 2012CJ34-2]